MAANIFLPRIVRLGAGAIRALPEILSVLQANRPLIVTDAYLAESGRVQMLVDLLGAAGVSARVFADTVPEPTASSIERALDFLLLGDHDCVVGFGGGSPIDSAKAIAVLAVHGGAIQDLKAPHLQDDAGLPIVAIPTTAGTGSEATRFTVITDDSTDEKMLCAGLAYLPVAAIVDYELTISKPARLTADTGIDALTHAIEAYVSRRANAFSDAMALQAMQHIAPNIRRVWDDPQDHPAREAMMIGSTLAGIAFSNASVALVHGMSRPIGAHFHVPHGLSNAMLLPTVTAFSAPAALRRYAECARAMRIVADDEGDQIAVARLIEELEALNRYLAVPNPRSYGIDASRWKELLPAMAAQALASGSPDNNPIVPSVDDIVQLYERVWDF